MFWFVNTVTNIQQDQKAKLDYHMPMLFAQMAGKEGGGIKGLKMFCQRGSEFFLLSLCVCVGGGVRFSTSPSVKKISDPPPINKSLIPITKSSRVTTSLIFFKILLLVD